MARETYETELDHYIVYIKKDTYTYISCDFTIYIYTFFSIKRSLIQTFLSYTLHVRALSPSRNITILLLLL